MSESQDPTVAFAFGSIFVVLGALVLLDQVTGLDISFRLILPVVLIIAGIVVILGARPGPGRRQS